MQETAGYMPQVVMVFLLRGSGHPKTIQPAGPACCPHLEVTRGPSVSSEPTSCMHPSSNPVWPTWSQVHPTKAVSGSREVAQSLGFQSSSTHPTPTCSISIRILPELTPPTPKGVGAGGAGSLFKTGGWGCPTVGAGVPFRSSLSGHPGVPRVCALPTGLR